MEQVGQKLIDLNTARNLMAEQGNSNSRTRIALWNNWIQFI